VRVAIIGAGLGGVATAVRLHQAGINSFTVFDRNAGPGGVWWQNTYPGCEVDVPSHAYSYSFMPYNWSCTHAWHTELQRYVEDVIDQFGIRSHFQFSTEVLDSRWDDERAVHRVHTGAGTAEFDVVVSCVGMLSHPNIPAWPGLEHFRGPVFHTSRYQNQHDLSDKRVAVIGTGSTARQLVPALASQVRQLDLWQGEPGYVMPKKRRESDPEERARFTRSPLRQKWQRLRLFRAGYKVAGTLKADGEDQRRRRRYCQDYIRRTVHDTDLQRALTPGYAYGCKRPVFASGFYPALNRPNVRLIPNAVREVSAGAIVDNTGTERPADVLIMATGFHTTRYLATIPVFGPGGRSLQDV
jgi:cation diffusion facilitator CzcD-associated flavoprotein CzcO